MCVVNYEEIVCDFERAIARLILYGLTSIPFPITIDFFYLYISGINSDLMEQYDLNDDLTQGCLCFFSEQQIHLILKRLVEIGLLRTETITNQVEVYYITDKGDSFLENDWSYINPDFFKSLIKIK